MEPLKADQSASQTPGVTAKGLGLSKQSQVPARPALDNPLPCPSPLNITPDCLGSQSAAIFKATPLVQDQHASHSCCTARPSVVSHLCCLLLLRLRCLALGHLLASACTNSTHASGRWQMLMSTCTAARRTVSHHCTRCSRHWWQVGLMCTPRGAHRLLLHLVPPCEPGHAGCCREACCQQPCRLQEARRPQAPCCRCSASAPATAWSHPLRHACWQRLPAAAVPWGAPCPSLSPCTTAPG